MLKGVYLLAEAAFPRIYGEPEQSQISELLEISGTYFTREALLADRERLADVRIVFSGWGSPLLDAEVLDCLPSLELFLYGAGSIKRVASDAFWDRGLTICSAYGANAVPVSEFTLATILFSLKQGWYFAREMREQRNRGRNRPIDGAYGSTVGLISLGMIGRLMCRRLQPFDVQIVAYDPFVDQRTAREHGVTLVGLEDVFKLSNVVSLHTPLLPETTGMVQGCHFELMRENATFINTSRGAVVCEQEMISVLSRRPDLTAVLDVTHPEPPVPDSPLYTLPNVILTPHIAGSMGQECRRMGQYMIEELRRHIDRQPLQWAITRERARILA